MSAPLTDLHCHILPGIDDGSDSIGTTGALLRQGIDDGVRCFAFTPHFYYERDTLEAFAARRANAFAQTVRHIRDSQMKIAAKCGAEVYFTPALPTLDLSVLAYRNTNYILIELSTRHRQSGVDEVLYQLECRGYVPVLAHVERYPYLTEDPTILYEWVSGGALAHANAAAMIRRGKTASLIKKYIEWGLVHFICSDAHSPDHRPENLGEGLASLPDDTAKMLNDNAFAVFNGEELEIPEIIKPRQRFGKWV